MECPQEIRNKFIDDNAHLFWYIRKDALHNISDEVLVEFILNYGDLEQVKKLFLILGGRRLKEIFLGLKGRQKMNYYPEVLNFFGLLVNRYA